MHVPLGAHFPVFVQFRGRPGGFLSTMDAVVLNCVNQFNIVWRVGTYPFLPMSKCRRKTRCVTVAESLFLKKSFPRQTLNALPTDAAWWLKASNRSTQRCVFHRATYKDVCMALNLNRLIVSAPPCITNTHLKGICILSIPEESNCQTVINNIIFLHNHQNWHISSFCRAYEWLWV